MIDENWVKNTIRQAGEVAQRYFGKVIPSSKIVELHKKVKIYVIIFLVP